MTALRRIYPEKIEGKGFTLVELLVVVAIIGVLSTIGITVFTGANKSAQDAKKRADIDAIRKAYDTTYDPIANKYKLLTPSDFSDGKIPTPDSTTNTSYFSVAGPGSQDGTTLAQGQYFPTGEAFKVCTPLSGNTVSSTQCSSSASNCYCAQSPQGDPVANTTLSAVTNYPSCDTNGTLANGLVGYWKFDGDFNDALGNNNGTAMNGITTIAGKFSSAGSFNGSNNYVRIPNSTSLNISAYTVSAWIKPSIDGDFWTGIVGKPGRNFNMWLGQSNSASGYIHHRFHDSSSWNAGCPDATGITINGIAWTHVVITNDGATCKTYINGDSRASGSTGTLVVDNTDIQIGRNLDGGNGNYYNGMIDDVRIYSRALSPTEVTALYNGGNGCVPL